MTRVYISIVLVTCILKVSGEPVASWISPSDEKYYTCSDIVTIVGNVNNLGLVLDEKGLDLSIVIDNSEGMEGEKMTKAKEAAISLIHTLPFNNTQVAVSSYGYSAQTLLHLTPLNPDQQQIISAINDMPIGNNNGINLGAAIFGGALAASDPIYSRTSSGKAQLLINGHNNTIEIPDPASMQEQVRDIYDVTTFIADITNNPEELPSILDGSGGNLVGLERIDVTLPNGYQIDNYPLDNGLGYFSIPDWRIMFGENIFTVDAYFTNGEHASSELILIEVPEPCSLALFALTGVVIRLRR